MKLALPSIVPPIMTFCSTEASPITRGVWKVRAMPRAARNTGMPGGSASPPSAIVPALAA